jgi:hypothetical protein
MSSLTSRERLTRLFSSDGGDNITVGDIDRIPIWLLAPYHRLGCYADIYNIPCYKRITEYIDKYCDTFDRRGYSSGFCYNGNPDIKRSSSRYEKDGQSIHENVITYGNIVFKSHTSYGDQGTKVKRYLDGIDDFERQLDEILSIPYIKPTPDISNYQREKDELGDKGLMMTDIGDPLTTLYGFMSAEDFSMSTALYYDKILEFLDVIYERTLDMYKYLLERGIGEVFFIVGCEFAGPPLVHPDKFNEMSVRYVKGICDLVRSYGKHTMVHYHGNLYKVLSGIKNMNPDGLHTIEAPPIGDCTITQAREKLGKDMILVGNIQYDDLTRLDSETIDEMVRGVIEEGRSGKFILSPTAGPYETVLSERAVENYLAFIDAGIKYGRL